MPDQPQPDAGDGMFDSPAPDYFEHESPLRAFTNWNATGCYAVGKGWRPSAKHLPVYLDAIERKEGWQLVQVFPDAQARPSTMIFRKVAARIDPEKEKLASAMAEANGFAAPCEAESIEMPPRPVALPRDDFTWFYIEQARRPGLHFKGHIIARHEGYLKNGTEPIFEIFETCQYSLIAVTRALKPLSAQERVLRATVIECPTLDAQSPMLEREMERRDQTMRSAVMDHFDWDERAKEMVRDQLGWSLPLTRRIQ